MWTSSVRLAPGHVSPHTSAMMRSRVQTAAPERASTARTSNSLRESVVSAPWTVTTWRFMSMTTSSIVTTSLAPAGLPEPAVRRRR